MCHNLLSEEKNGFRAIYKIAVKTFNLISIYYVVTYWRKQVENRFQIGKYFFDYEYIYFLNAKSLMTL